MRVLNVSSLIEPQAPKFEQDRTKHAEINKSEFCQLFDAAVTLKCGQVTLY